MQDMRRWFVGKYGILKRAHYSLTGNYWRVGEVFLRYFIEIGELKPNERVLDVGCGVGRMAIPLTEYFKDGGSYEGFDIVATGITWCRKKITPRHPTFHFQLADVYNGRYNPKGTRKASEYRFPYDENDFDFVFLSSVFTHMLPQDMETYLSEVTRVLKPGGRSFITFFLLNTESLRLIGEKKSSRDFQYTADGYRAVNESKREFAVAYDEGFIRMLYGKYGMSISEPIHYGSWCGRKEFLSYQDIILANRNE